MVLDVCLPLWISAAGFCCPNGCEEDEVNKGKVEKNAIGAEKGRGIETGFADRFS